jgi:glutamine amidotransferase
MFLLALQFGLREAPIAAMAAMVGFVEDLAEHTIGSILLRFTAAFSDGNTLYAIRYATDRKAPTLYASPVGAGYCLVSEPLNDDVDAWAEIPDGSAVTVGKNGIDVADFRPENRRVAKLQPLAASA